LRGQPRGFVCSPLIAPDERRAQDAAGCVQQHGAVHLAAQTHRGNLFRGSRSRFQQARDGVDRGLPPVFGILFSPARLRRAEWKMISNGGTENFARGIHQQDTRATGANIYPDQFHRPQGYAGGRLSATLMMIAATGCAQYQLGRQDDPPLQLVVWSAVAVVADHIEEHAGSAASQLQCGLPDRGERGVE
jgi:hypothetical protein